MPRANDKPMTDADIDINMLLKNIRYQCEKNQFLNASYECAELQKVLLTKLSHVLKGDADAESE